jgi:opacity protein-like surface antigen
MLCKGLLLSGVALVIASASAFPNELKLVRKAPQPAVAAPLPPIWAGLYAGPTLGWARGRSDGYYQGTTPPAPAPVPPVAAVPLLVRPNGDSLCGFPDEFGSAALTTAAQYSLCSLLDPITPGALAGYNFQFGRVVAGIEADVGWIGRHSPQVPAPDGSQRWDQFGVTWTSHVRGRLGYAFGQYLPYLAGGLALAGYNVAHFRSDATGSVLYTANDTRVGYTIGGGVEIANLFPSLLPGWVFRGEYLYDHFNPKQYDWVRGMRYTVLDLTMHTLRAAATYRFSAAR